MTQTVPSSTVANVTAVQTIPAAVSGERARYRELSPARIIETTCRLEARIQERFPGSGLRQLALEVTQIAREAMVRAEQIRQPHYGLRLGAIGLIGLMLAVLAMLLPQVRPDDNLFLIEEFIQTLEAALGSMVFIGAAVVFLVTVETRWKRQRALSAIRELRALAHIIDMHQLTKDQESTLRGRPTASSPQRTLTQYELGRYLDYCSELLSLINKIGAIYVQELPDAVALEAVDQLSNLTNSLSRNIWQKLMILDLAVEPGRSKLTAPPPPGAGN